MMHYRLLLLLCACWFTNISTAQDITLTTSDKVSIAATLSIPENAKDKNPAVILIHQGGRSRDEWKAYIPKFLEEGYVVLAYDVRGHGASDRVSSISQLFNDPNLAPKDLKAVCDYLVKHKAVDPERIGIVGASIGSNLACMAAGHEDYPIKTAVAISGKTEAVYNLAGDANLQIKSVFYISSDGDQRGRRADWADEMYKRTGPPHKLMIVPGSIAHGTRIFQDEPEVLNHIITWLSETL